MLDQDAEPLDREPFLFHVRESEGDSEPPARLATLHMLDGFQGFEDFGRLLQFVGQDLVEVRLLRNQGR